MAFNLKNRHLLSLAHHSTEEIKFLVGLAADLKEAKYCGTEQPLLRGKNIALIFEKASTRTRCAFEVAAHDQGAHVTYLGPSGSHIGHKESMKDTARVLGRMYDGIEYRGFHQSVVEELAEYAGVPVFNGLTDEFHPTQMLADALTMREHAEKPFHEIKFAYVGDGRNNMGRSLLLLGAKLGMDVRIGAPEGLQPEAELVERCREWAEQSGGKVLVTASAEEAVRDVDFIHTDVWVSMGEPVESWSERVGTLLPFQINDALVKAAGNPRVKVMHCLPAFHNSE
ncbi:MAG: ornithine carbamoyltransferase, partial [Cutibacterium sp.]